MKTILRTTFVLLLGLAMATPAFAGERGGKGKGKGKGRKAARLFARFDKDKSGSLTSDEVPAKLWTRLEKADADGDGAVTKAELRAKHKERRGKKKGSGTDG